MNSVKHRIRGSQHIPNYTQVDFSIWVQFEILNIDTSWLIDSIIRSIKNEIN